MSKTLSHNLGKWGTIAPTSILVIRVFSSLLYNAWRLHSLSKVEEYLNSDKCKSYSRYQKERLRKGGTFENFLLEAFNKITLPENLKRLPQYAKNTSAIEGYVRPVSKGSRQSRDDYNTPEWVWYRIGGKFREGKISMYPLRYLNSIERSVPTVLFAQGVFLIRKKKQVNQFVYIQMGLVKNQR